MASISMAPLGPVAPTARNPHKSRKRATKACLSCRARKVRCDVSQRGRPCMNCYLDSETCIVTSRASRSRKITHEGNDGAQVSHSPNHCEESSGGCSHGGGTADDAVSSGANGESTSPQAELLEVVGHPHIAENLRPKGNRIQPAQKSYPAVNEPLEPSFNQPPSPPIHEFDNVSSIPPQSFDSSLVDPGIPFWSGEQPAPTNTNNTNITYSYYPFLAIGNLHNVMPQDVNFLESQGCLKLPTRPILDEFVQQYFLHVHPLLPFLNEGDFWNLYCHHQGGGGGGDVGDKMSLLVFQAMLFSCCNFVSKTSIKALGFPDIRTARATMYRRTKLLFDFDTESSLVCLSQAALLLTYWAPNWSLAAKKPNTAWLGVAIHNAKSAEAHMYSAMPTFSPVTEPAMHKKQNALKRLWWCCIFRDRLVSLGMRRSIQVSRAHFDVDSNTRLGFADLASEVGQSKVYGPETKRRLIEIFVQLGELCSVLTDLLTLVFPLDDVPGWGRQNGAEGAEKVRKCKVALRRWYNAAALRFPMFAGGSTSSETTGDNKHPQHDSVVLYTNLMYMFYHSARAVLCHHEVLQAAMASASPNANSSLHGFSNIYESRHELQGAASGVTECLNELIQRRLARWLPISAIACTATPLVLHIIDVKLLYQNRLRLSTPDEKRRTVLKQQRLNILIEAMKTYQPQYDGVDYVSETIRHIVNLAQIDPPPTGSPTPSISAFPEDPSADNMRPIISDWTDILASHPGSYLRLTMTLDISISKGRLATEADFPVKLRGLFAHGVSPIRALLSEGHFNNTTVAAPRASPAAAHLQPGNMHSASSDEDSTSPDSAADGVGMDDNNNNSALNLDGADRDAAGEESLALIDGPPGARDRDENENENAHVQTDTDMFIDMDYTLDVDVDVDMGYSLGDGAHDDADDERATSSDHSGSGSGNTHDDAGQDREEEEDEEVDWIERAWDDEEGMRVDVDGVGHGYADGVDVDVDVDIDDDKETARILLDALQDGRVFCAAPHVLASG
ncbi:hypothetical protein F5Y14DRAFT_396631 [Nemania sp. NC0429]|nr:hypothetical protein F5Y14DRAFT_396631 [Nemania sp. NC0429]